MKKIIIATKKVATNALYPNLLNDVYFDIKGSFDGDNVSVTLNIFSDKEGKGIYTNVHTTGEIFPNEKANELVGKVNGQYHDVVVDGLMIGGVGVIASRGIYGLKAEDLKIVEFEDKFPKKDDDKELDFLDTYKGKDPIVPPTIKLG